MLRISIISTISIHSDKETARNVPTYQSEEKQAKDEYLESEEKLRIIKSKVSTKYFIKFRPSLTSRLRKSTRKGRPKIKRYNSMCLKSSTSQGGIINRRRSVKQSAASCY